MVVIVAQINQFRYFLRFDKNGEGFAEGLINNATVLTEEQGKLVLKYLHIDWPLSIFDWEQEKINSKKSSLKGFCSF